MTFGDRLGRLLFIVPYVAHRDGVPLRELAEKLDVKPAQIEADLNLLSMVGQPPLTPDHLIDLYIEDDVVYVDLDQSLSRPLTLTHTEARALVLAAKLVGSLGGLGDELNALVDRILEHLNPVDAAHVRDLSRRVGLWQDGAEPHGPTLRLRSAITERSEVEIDYYSVSSDQQKRYRLQPLALISHSGVDYLAALDVGAERREKLYRLDRLGTVTLTETTFEPPEGFDLEKYRKPTLYFGADDKSAEVRFAPEEAQVVMERFADRLVRSLPDGSVQVHLTTSSAAWLARWVLPFGTRAEIVAPPEQRQSLGALCREAAKAYRRPVHG